MADQDQFPIPPIIDSTLIAYLPGKGNSPPTVVFWDFSDTAAAQAAQDFLLTQDAWVCKSVPKHRPRST